MSKQKRHNLALNIVAGFFVFLTIALISFTLLYIYPREPVIYEDYKTDKTEYRVGERVVASAVVTRNYEADITIDLRLRCNNGRYLLRYFELRAETAEATLTTADVGAIPEIPVPDECVLENITCSEVNLIFNFNRTYCTVWDSEKFKVQ